MDETVVITITLSLIVIQSPTDTSVEKVVPTPITVLLDFVYTAEVQVGLTSVLLIRVQSLFVFALVAPHKETRKLFPRSPTYFATNGPKSSDCVPPISGSYVFS